jgi:hypothetical protein
LIDAVEKLGRLLELGSRRSSSSGRLGAKQVPPSSRSRSRSFSLDRLLLRKGIRRYPNTQKEKTPKEKSVNDSLEAARLDGTYIP